MNRAQAVERALSVLTVDLGNTRLKAVLWEVRGSSADDATIADRLESGSDAPGPLENWLAGRRPSLAALASVGDPARTAALRARLARAAAEVHVAPASGLENRCREPERVGLDRLYAAAAAAALVGRSVLVADAGTALTVDAVLVRGSTRAFLGGAIAPGPALLASALARGTARLPLVEPRAGAPALGRGTEEAIQAGIAVGFRGAAERLVEELAREAGIASAPVVLTGGARSFLLEPGPFTARELVVEPELVQRGLLAAVLRAERA